MEKEHNTVQDIISVMSHSITGAERKLLEKACAYAEKKHEGQTRYSGLPYYTHAFEVGKLLAEIGMSANVVAAGILHDTIEDTDTTVEDLLKDFNKEVAFLVDGVSHLGEVRYQGLDVRVKSLQKLFIATSKDIRVIVIKLMDRLHNMRTLDAVPKTKQKRIAKETHLVYAPIANRLGMGKLNTALENLAFKHLKPDSYASLKKDIDTAIGSVSMGEIEEKIKEGLAAKGVTDLHLSSRVKSVYSTYMKMKDKKYSLEQIQDLIALRVFVRDIPSAYTVLGILHANWQPVPGTFKDYISFPKPNGYQALHTRVIIDRHILEIQVLTDAMHRHAQFGIASHFKYKEKRHGVIGPDLRWFEKLLSLGQRTKNTSWVERASSMYINNSLDESVFAEDAQSDFLQDRMFIFTPKGEVVDLPRGATVADFAFSVHSAIGLHAKGAFVNKKYVSLNHELRGGDIVTVQTGKKPTVTKKWLDWVKTAEARSRIRQFIKKNS